MLSVERPFLFNEEQLDRYIRRVLKTENENDKKILSTSYFRESKNLTNKKIHE